MNTSSLSHNSGEKLRVFQNEKFGEVRTVVIDGEPWFVAKDIAAILEYRNAPDMTRILDEDEKGTQIVRTLGGNQEMNTTQIVRSIPSRGNPNISVINESGLYHAVFQSRKPEAQDFRKWVTSEVLPSIRKTESYNADSAMKSARQTEEKPYVVRVECAKLLHEIANEYQGKSENYKQVLDAYATKEITGEFLLPLPEGRRTYSAGEIGKMLGISASKVGSIAIKNGLKTAEFGVWVHDKSRYSSKEVDTFRYYDNVLPELKKAVAEAE